MTKRRASALAATLAGLLVAGGAHAEGDPEKGRYAAQTCLGCHGIPDQANVVPTRDAWRNLYDYRAEGIRYTLESFGKDGVDGSDISVASRDDFTLDIVLADGRFTASPE